MKEDMLQFHSNIEKRLQIYYGLVKYKSHFSARYNIDPLAWLIVNNIPRQHKLEILLLALTLLRFKDCKSLDHESFLNNNELIILQGKTKRPVQLQPLFLSDNSQRRLSLPIVSVFTDSYDKFNYTLQNAIPTWLKQSLKTERSVTHIFRFLRTSFMYLKHNDFYLSSRYLGHKDPESVRSYVPPELLTLYSNYLSKG